MGFDSEKQYLTRGTSLMAPPRPVPFSPPRPMPFAPPRRVRPIARNRRALWLILLAGLLLTGYSLRQQGTFGQLNDFFLTTERSLSPGRDPTTWPFSARSPWNLPLAQTAAFEGQGGGCTAALTDPSIPAALNTTTWSHAVFVASMADPQRQVTIEYDPATSGRNTIALRIPANAMPSPPAATEGGDARMYIIDPTHRVVDEFWKMRPVGNGNWAARVHVHTDLYGTGVGAWGTRAYGGSGIGGLLRAGELRDGIHHAIAFAVPERQQNGSFVWPAIARDFGYPDSVYKGPIPMGQFVAIPPSVDLAKLGLSPEGGRFARALQDYGGYVVDSSTNNSYYADPPVEREAGGLANDLQRIHAQLRCVTNNTAQTIGGGAADALRRAALAAPLQGAPWGADRLAPPPIATIPEQRRPLARNR